MDASFFWRCRYRCSSPRRFGFLLIIVEGFDQAGEHFCRSLEQRLGLRLGDFANVFAQMINELTHLSFDFLRVANGIIFRRGVHISGAFLEAWLLSIWLRPLFLSAGFIGRGTLMSSAALKSISCCFTLKIKTGQVMRAR